MKLMTKAIEKRFAKLGKQDKPDAIVVAKFFLGPATWYATAFEPEAGTGGGQFFGYVTGLGHNELGYFSLQELQEAKGQFGLGVERDLHWTETTLDKIMGEQG